MADNMQLPRKPSPVGKWLKDDSGKYQIWAFLPVLSGMAFLGILFLYACQLDLPNLDWGAVRTNTVIAQLKGEVAAEKGASLQLTNLGIYVAKVKDKADQTDPLTKEVVVRLLWASSAVLFAFLCLCAIAFSVRIFHKVMESPPNTLATCGFAVSLGAVYFILLFICWTEFSSLSGGNTVNQLFNAMEGKEPALTKNLGIVTNVTPTPTGLATNFTIEVTPEKGLEKLRPKQVPVSNIRRLTAYITAGAETGFGAVAFAASFLALAVRKINQKSTESIALFEDHVSRGMTLLQLTAVALVVGVIQVYLLLTLASCHVTPDLTKEIQSFARGGATVVGFIYTGMLAAIFIPMAAEQRTTARKLLHIHRNNEAAMDREAVKRFRQLGDIDAASWPVIKTAITLLSPMLAGFVTKLFASLFTQF